MGKYSEYDRATLSAGWRVALYIIVGILFFGGLSWGILAIRAATSETKGGLDAEIKINSGQNQIASQELFQQLYAKVKEYDKNIDVLAAAVKDDPSSFNKTNLTGQILMCNQAVEEYNAETDKISSAKWLSRDLPYKIDETASETDCKESAK